MTSQTRPCYLIVGRTRTSHDDAAKIRRKEFQAMARVAIDRLGIKFDVVGFASAETLSPLAGAWSFGDAVIERYESLAMVLEFWASPEYQAALAHRDGLPVLNFVLAVEGGVREASHIDSPAGYSLVCGRPRSGATRLVGPEGASVTELAYAEPDQQTVLKGAWPYSGAVMLHGYSSVAAIADSWSCLSAADVEARTGAAVEVAITIPAREFSTGPSDRKNK